MCRSCLPRQDSQYASNMRTDLRYPAYLVYTASTALWLDSVTFDSPARHTLQPASSRVLSDSPPTAILASLSDIVPPLLSLRCVPLRRRIVFGGHGMVEWTNECGELLSTNDEPISISDLWAAMWCPCSRDTHRVAVYASSGRYPTSSSVLASEQCQHGSRVVRKGSSSLQEVAKRKTQNACDD